MGGGNHKYPSKNYQEYKDLDDPKLLIQSKTSRAIMDYGDL